MNRDKVFIICLEGKHDQCKHIFDGITCQCDCHKQNICPADRKGVNNGTDSKL